MILFLFICYLCTWSAIPHLLLQRKGPSSTLAWLWTIIFFPFAGFFLFLLIGGSRIRRKHWRLIASSRGLRFQKTSRNSASSLLSSLSERDQKLFEMLSFLNCIRTSEAHSIRILKDAQEFYPLLKKRIQEAKHYIHIQFYIWRNDEVGREFLKLLIEAAQRGVKVRLLLDEIGSFHLRKSFFKPLIQVGGRFSWFHSLNPLKNRYSFNLRNHRKLQIIDGSYAFVGGMNLGEEYQDLTWRDIQVEVSGPASYVLQEAFADDWYYATEEKLIEEFYPKESSKSPHLVQILSGGPDTQDEPIQKSIVCLLHHASTRAWLSTGYFVPNEVLLTSLKISAARGVDVRLLISEKNNHRILLQVGRSYYEELLRFGVRLFEYSEGVNHSKIGVFDDSLSMIGSANLDNRSMRLNFETNLLIHSKQQNESLSQIFEDDLSICREIKLEEFVNRSAFQKITEVILRPFAPLL
jgi:cardiolipin synthase